MKSFQTQYIVGGFARALNEMVSGELGENYVFAVRKSHAKEFLSIAVGPAHGVFIDSPLGKTWDEFIGTDVSITVGTPEPDDILIPAHFVTIRFLIDNLLP